jgi:glycosyltransferase involved in cell wall biosynthesis
MPNLGGSGADRVISIILNNLDRNKFTLNLIIISNLSNNIFLNDLKNDIKVFNLNINKRLRYSFYLILYKVFKIIKNESPDVLFFGSGSINVLFSPFLFLFPPNLFCVARESNIPSLFEKNFILKLFYRFSYKNFNKIIAQSDDMMYDLVNNFNIPKSKIIKINNPVDSEFIQNRLLYTNTILFQPNTINLISIGRLTFQKGFDQLIMNLSKLKNYKYHLTILGEGEEYETLLNLIRFHNLENNITLIGYVANPYPYLKAADFLILSSRFEGFPNVLIESLICGCPVLANKCKGGIDEIIIDGFNGYTYDSNNFLFKFNSLLTTKFNKDKIMSDTKNKFDIEYIVSKYENILC